MTTTAPIDSKVISFSIPFDFKEGKEGDPTKESLWLFFQGEKLLVSSDNKLPSFDLFQKEHSSFIGEWQGSQFYAASIPKEVSPPQDYEWKSLRKLFEILPDPYFAIAGRAMQIVEWNRTTSFCGCCGQKTVLREHERCNECPSCGALFYLKLAPAVMALVKKGSKILLARSPHFPPNIFSVLAGFLDPGETLEQTIAREVFEEVGISVKNITYFGSQSWPFSHSLMIAFTCEWDSGEIALGPEIEAADWFEMDNLPLLPSPYSIARVLIDEVSSR